MMAALPAALWILLACVVPSGSGKIGGHFNITQLTAHQPKHWHVAVKGQTLRPSWQGKLLRYKQQQYDIMVYRIETSQYRIYFSMCPEILQVPHIEKNNYNIFFNG